MTTEEIKRILQQLTGHKYITITARGNAAITAALNVIPLGGVVLIPEEGGWIHYEKAPPKLGLKVVKVSCNDAVINLDDLRLKLTQLKPKAFLYQNPGGYFAQQPMTEIYDLCKKHDCLVILDISGSIGTPLCDGRYADIFVGSFGHEKLVNAHVGGFISSNDKQLFEKIIKNSEPLQNEESLAAIYQELQKLPGRIEQLTKLRTKIIQDLASFNVVHPKDIGFVVVIKYSTPEEKQKLISYCRVHQLEYTECPRYIRLNKPAISIEVKRN